MTADNMTDEEREALAIYADALSKATTDKERREIRQAVRELHDPQLLGAVICLWCLREFAACECPN